MTAAGRPNDPAAEQATSTQGDHTMSKPTLRAVDEDGNGATSVETVHPTTEVLDEEEMEFRALRRDLPGVKGASAVGIVSISVAKTPGKNEFFRTHPDFRPVVSIVDLEVGMERQYFAVTDAMVEALAGIGISVSLHTIYLTVTAHGAVKIVPIRHAGMDGEQNEYNRTKEIGLLQGVKRWVRLYTDRENKCYKVFPAPEDRFPDPQWPDLKPAKIFRLAFRDKGRLVDSPEHPLVQRWAARDKDAG
jgi:hypothetical protein